MHLAGKRTLLYIVCEAAIARGREMTPLIATIMKV